MLKFVFNPGARCALARSTRTQKEWKVETHMRSACGPTISTTRSRISAAALLVKVIARICHGATPFASR